MPRFPLLLGAAFVAMAAWSPNPSHAAWPHDPTSGIPICTQPYSQVGPSACSDGVGGMFVAWFDNRSPLNDDIYIQHVDAEGTPLWTTDGSPVCTAIERQDSPSLVPDGAGGVFVAWRDYRADGVNGDVYVQRIGPNGNPVPGWPTNGLQLSFATQTGDVSPIIEADGAGGAYVAWTAYWNNFSDPDPHLNHVGPTPTAWANPVAGTGSTATQFTTDVVESGGHAYLLWTDRRNGTDDDVYVQRFSATGTPTFVVGGLMLGVGAADHRNAKGVADGFDGIVVAYDDVQKVYGARLTSTGLLAIVPQTIICDAADIRAVNSVVADGSGGMFVVWADNRAQYFVGYDIYASHMNKDGGIPSSWVPNGNVIAILPNLIHPVASDGAGGAFVSWNASDGIRMQHLAGSGVAWPGWPAPGRVVYAYSYAASASVVPDGNQGALVAISARPNGNVHDVFAQRVERFSQLGEPEPTIASARDVKNDQGGQIKVSWDASYLDAPPEFAVGSYELWRSLPAAAARAALTAGARLLAPDETPAGGGRFLRLDRSAAATIYWEYVGNQPAGGQAGYSYTVPTAGDSVSGSNPYTLVKVVARPPWGPEYWESAADSGYSVDNLAPAVPAPFTGTYVSGSGAYLQWGANGEPDLAGYRLYRGFTPSFVPGPGNRIAEPASPGYSDPGAPPAYYKLSAVDVHGNESGFALLIPDGTLAVEEPDTPSEVSLAPIAPNPARGPIALRFGLPAAGRISIAVFDPQGRRVRRIVEGHREPGVYTERWEGTDEAGGPAASGLYIVRLEAGGRVLTRRFVTVR